MVSWSFHLKRAEDGPIFVSCLRQSASSTPLQSRGKTWAHLTACMLVRVQGSEVSGLGVQGLGFKGLGFRGLGV